MMLRLRVIRVKAFTIFITEIYEIAGLRASFVGGPGRPGRPERAGAGRCVSLLRLFGTGNAGGVASVFRQLVVIAAALTALLDAGCGVGPQRRPAWEKPGLAVAAMPALDSEGY
jgi:hypothetical protein